MFTGKENQYDKNNNFQKVVLKIIFTSQDLTAANDERHRNDKSKNHPVTNTR